MTAIERGKLLGADMWASMARRAQSAPDRRAFEDPDGPEQLLTLGYARLKPIWPAEVIADLARRAEALLSAGRYTWTDSQGSDVRIMGVERLDPAFATVLRQPLFDSLHRFVSGMGYGDSTILANRLTPQPKNAGSGGGWHRDSPFTHQFKIFVFLSDVEPQNGPLTVIPGSHTRAATERYHQTLNMPLSAYRYDDAGIGGLTGGALPEPVQVTGPAGTVLAANTRMLHRGSPIEAGSRLMLTNYYFPRAIPQRLVEQFPALALPA